MFHLFCLRIKIILWLVQKILKREKIYITHKLNHHNNATIYKRCSLQIYIHTHTYLNEIERSTYIRGHLIYDKGATEISEEKMSFLINGARSIAYLHEPRILTPTLTPFMEIVQNGSES